LPTDFTAHAAPLCAATATATPFDAPSAWDGACTEANPIFVNQMCPPGTYCVQSLSIAPLTIDQAGCTGVTDPVPALSGNAAMFARACPASTSPECTALVKDCFAEPPPPGFKLCTYKDGDKLKCPAPYTEKYIFATEWIDHRTCTDCHCGVPTGSTCVSQISIYSTPGCSGVPFWSDPVTSDPGFCKNVLPAGTAFRSKEATAPVYTSGTCQPFGGNLIGWTEPVGPQTVCCLP
jgi:hypothetical protein